MASVKRALFCLLLIALSYHGNCASLRSQQNPLEAMIFHASKISDAISGSDKDDKSSEKASEKREENVGDKEATSKSTEAPEEEEVGADLIQSMTEKAPRGGFILPGSDFLGHGFNILTGEVKSPRILSLEYPSDVDDPEVWSKIGAVKPSKCIQRMQRTTDDFRDDQTYLLPINYSVRPTFTCSFSSSAEFFSSVDNYAQSLSVSAGISIPGAFSLSSTVSTARSMTSTGSDRLMVSSARCTNYRVALNSLRKAKPSRLLEQFFGLAGLLKCQDGFSKQGPPCVRYTEAETEADKAPEVVIESVEPVKALKPTEDPEFSVDGNGSGKSESKEEEKGDGGSSDSKPDGDKDDDAKNTDLLEVDERVQAVSDKCLQKAHERFIAPGSTNRPCMMGMRARFQSDIQKNSKKDPEDPHTFMGCKRLFSNAQADRDEFTEFCGKVRDLFGNKFHSPGMLVREFQTIFTPEGDKPLMAREKREAIFNNFCKKNLSYSICSVGRQELCRNMLNGAVDDYENCFSKELTAEEQQRVTTKLQASTASSPDAEVCNKSVECKDRIAQCAQLHLLTKTSCHNNIEKNMNAADTKACDEAVEKFKEKFKIPLKDMAMWSLVGSLVETPVPVKVPVMKGLSESFDVLSFPHSDDQNQVKKFCTEQHTTVNFIGFKSKKNSYKFCQSMLMRYTKCVRSHLAPFGFKTYDDNPVALGDKIGSQMDMKALLTTMKEQYDDKTKERDIKEDVESLELVKLEETAFKNAMFNNRPVDPNSVFKRMFDMFGTHYIESTELGGSVDEVAVTSRRTAQDDSSFSAGMTFSIETPYVGVNGGASHSDSESTTQQNDSDKTEVRLYGGRPAGMASDSNLKDVWEHWAPTTIKDPVPVNARYRSVCEILELIDVGEGLVPIDPDLKAKLVMKCNLRMESYVRTQSLATGAYTIIMETAMGSLGPKEAILYKMNSLHLSLKSDETAELTPVTAIMDYPLQNLRGDLNMINFAPGQISEFGVEGPYLHRIRSIGLRPDVEPLDDGAEYTDVNSHYLLSRAVIIDRTTGRPSFFKYPMVANGLEKGPAEQVRARDYPVSHPSVANIDMPADPLISLYVYLKNDDRAPTVSPRLYFRIHGTQASITIKAHLDKKVPFYDSGVWKLGSCYENYWAGAQDKAPKPEKLDRDAVSEFWSKKYKKDLVSDLTALKFYCSNLMVPGGISRFDIHESHMPQGSQGSWLGRLLSVEVQNYHDDAVGISMIRVFDGSSGRVTEDGDKEITSYVAVFNDQYVGLPAAKSKDGKAQSMAARVFGGRTKTSDKENPVTNATPTLSRPLESRMPRATYSG